LVASNSELLAIGNNGEQRKFAALPGDFYSYWLRWSPDGRVLRFMTNGATGDRLWQVGADGKDLHQIFENLEGNSQVGQGNWTPDGKYFVFRVTENNRNDLWAVREKGDLWHKVSHAPFRLTAGPLSLEAPQPSADGKKIFAVGSQQRSELVRYDPKSAQFIPYLGGVSAMNVNFSRDGKWISYVTWPEGELWRCRVDGSEKLQLTTSPVFVSDAQWSPDGTQIAFAAGPAGGTGRIFLVPANAGVAREVVSGGTGVGLIGWGGDPNTLFFFDTTSPEIAALHSFDLKTMKEKSVPDSNGRVYARPSPDGRYLAALSVDGQKLLIFDIASQKWSELTNGNMDALVWSRDSKFVYFDTQSGGEQGVYRVAISSHGVEKVADLKNVRRVVLPFGQWMGLTPEGSPLLMRDIGTQEVYGLDFEEP